MQLLTDIALVHPGHRSLPLGYHELLRECKQLQNSKKSYLTLLGCMNDEEESDDTEPNSDHSQLKENKIGLDAFFA